MSGLEKTVYDVQSTMKILIIYASAGAGHRKAAEALYNSFNCLNLPKLSIQKIDALDYTNSIFKRMYPAVYIFLVKYLSFLWGIFFHFLNCPQLAPLIGNLRHFFNYLNGKPLCRYILGERPDIVLCVHFFSAELIASLKASRLFKGLVICGVTDFGVHRFWINKGTDFYLVASEMTKDELKRKGVAADKILVTGIPVGRKFSEAKQKDVICDKLGLDKDRFIVLVTSGGFGVGPIKRIVNNLDRMDRPLQIVVICGKNAQLYEFLNKQRFRKTVKVFGYVNNMDEFMSIAGIIITKSGGLTVSESLAKELPMMIIKPIPGQEARNAQVLEKYNAGVRLLDVDLLINQMDQLLDNDMQKLNEMRKNAQMLAKPHAADRICQWVVKDLLLKN